MRSSGPQPAEAGSSGFACSVMSIPMMAKFAVGHLKHVRAAAGGDGLSVVCVWIRAESSKDHGSGGWLVLRCRQAAPAMLEGRWVLGHHAWPYKAIFREGQVFILCGVNESKVVELVVAKLRKEREKQGISQAELSRRTGLSRSGIRHMEAGEVTPTLLFLLKIARELQVSIGGFLKDLNE